MTIEEPSPDPASSGSGLPISRSLSPDDLRQRMQRRLERHVDAGAAVPSLTALGLTSKRTDVLGVGLDSPEKVLLGFQLPANYDAVGVLASSVVATKSDRRHEPAALGIAVSRAGCVVSLLATNDDIITTRDPHGWLIDACRRAVSLPTSPCEISPLAFPVVLWLDRLMVSILNSATPSPMTWSAAATLCPVPKRWRSIDPIDLGSTLGSTTRSWSTLRQAAVQGAPCPIEMNPAWAAWMDDAMFARWCMGAFPDASSLRADVEFLAPPEVAENIELALRAAWLAFAD